MNVGLVVGAAMLVPTRSLAVELSGSGRITPITATEFSDVLAEHSGSVVLINFWASWCVPCLREIPELVELAERYHDRGLTLVPFSLDDPGDLEPIVLPFLNQRFPDFTSYARVDLEMDTVVSVVDDAWNEILPTSYVLDRDGNVAELIQGGKAIEDFEAAVLPLLDPLSEE